MISRFYRYGKLKLTSQFMKKKAILAYSGGLDTSFCVPYLRETHGAEVHTVTVNTGGFTAEEPAAEE